MCALSFVLHAGWIGTVATLCTHLKGFSVHLHAHVVTVWWCRQGGQVPCQAGLGSKAGLPRALRYMGYWVLSNLQHLRHCPLVGSECHLAYTIPSCRCNGCRAPLSIILVQGTLTCQARHGSVNAASHDALPPLASNCNICNSDRYHVLWYHANHTQHTYVKRHQTIHVCTAHLAGHCMMSTVQQPLLWSDSTNTQPLWRVANTLSSS